MDHYTVEISEILESVGASVSVSGAVALGDLVVGDVSFESAAPAHVDVTISNAGEALVAYGTVSGAFAVCCSRCLEPFEIVIGGDVEGYWPRPGHDVLEDQDVTGEVDAEGCVDLLPALLAALVVDAPFAPLHDEDCLGLCPQCGANLNDGPCSCADVVDADNPFAALGSLLENNEAEE